MTTLHSLPPPASPAAAPQRFAATPRTPTSDEVRRYLPLVMEEARRMRRRLPASVLYEDLVAAGTVGLLDALRRDDPDGAPTFPWYARIRIRGAIIDDLRAQDWLSRRARQIAETESESVRPPSWTGVVSLDGMPAHAHARNLPDVAPSALEAVIACEDSSAVETAVRALPAREQAIVRQHYFQDVQFKAVAAELGVSDPRVSQLHTRALGMLKSLLRQRSIDEAA